MKELIIILYFTLLLQRDVFYATFRTDGGDVIPVRIVAKDRTQADSIARIYQSENGYTRYFISTKKASALTVRQDTSINNRILIINY